MINKIPAVVKDKHYNQSETAKILEVSFMTVKRANDAGKIQGIKQPNKQVVYSGEEIIKYWKNPK